MLIASFSQFDPNPTYGVPEEIELLQGSKTLLRDSVQSRPGSLVEEALRQHHISGPAARSINLNSILDPSEDNIGPSHRAVHADLLIGLQVSIEIKRHIGAAEILNGNDHDLVGAGELLYQR
jgi:hypothetical protein